MKLSEDKMNDGPGSILLWHPFTPRGVAGAVRAPRWQLWTALGATAALSVLSVTFFLSHCWSPVIEEAIQQLADGGLLRKGVLQPGGERTNVMLASNRYLAIALDWTAVGARDQASDVRVILQIDRALFCSLFGCATISYRGLGDMPVGRTETGAWWQAWRPAIYSSIGLGQVLFLILSWWVLGIAYAWAIRLFAFYLDRDVDFSGATRLAQAALIPGAIWLTVAVYFHAQGWLSLIGLLIVLVMHLPIGWIYAGLACRQLPRRPDVLPHNPFQPMTETPGAAERNPFSGTGAEPD